MRLARKQVESVSPLGRSAEEVHREQLRDPAYRQAHRKFAVAEQCARALIQHRMNTNQTQRELADQLQMTESMVSRLERGDHVPNVETLCRIADALGKDLVVSFAEPIHAAV